MRLEEGGNGGSGDDSNQTGLGDEAVGSAGSSSRGHGGGRRDNLGGGLGVGGDGDDDAGGQSRDGHGGGRADVRGRVGDAPVDGGAGRGGGGGVQRRGGLDDGRRRAGRGGGGGGGAARAVRDLGAALGDGESARHGRREGGGALLGGGDDGRGDERKDAGETHLEGETGGVCEEWVRLFRSDRGRRGMQENVRRS